jgi:hypothetical protein
LVSATEEYFSAQGFRRSEPSSADVTDIYNIFNGGVVAVYEKGILTCIVSTYPQSGDDFASFFCGHVDERADALRREFSPVVNPNNSRVVINIRQIVGNYAVVVVSGRGTGAVSYLVKQAGVWTKVWGGQNLIDCKVARQHEFPSEFRCENY